MKKINLDTVVEFPILAISAPATDSPKVELPGDCTSLYHALNVLFQQIIDERKCSPCYFKHTIPEIGKLPDEKLRKRKSPNKYKVECPDDVIFIKEMIQSRLTPALNKYRGCGMNNFYPSGDGDKLVMEKNYPQEITAFLADEKEIVRRILSSGNYSTLIEVGCMDGRAVPIALSKGLDYIGMDIVERYINNAKEKYSSLQPQISFVCGDSVNIGTICKHIKLPGLAMFPFNSLGNHSDPATSLKAVSNASLDLLVFTYQTNRSVRRVREKYYLNCGYKSIVLRKTSKGDEFTSKEGLSSIAFSPDYLKGILQPLFEKVKIEKFSDIGLMAYCSNGSNKNGNSN